MKKYFVLLLSISISLPIFAATYYVSNSGNDSYNGESPDSTFATLQQAANTVTAGDSVLVLSGDYQGFDLRGVDGTENDPIVFKAWGDSVRITDNNSRTDDGINLEGPDWVVIDGFTVAGVPRNGIRLVTAEHITIRNNTCLYNSRGIFTGFVDYVVIENNLCAYSWDEHGIYHSNSGDHPIIRYNICHNNNGSGIHMNGDSTMGGDGLITDATVEGNIIYDNGINGSGINCDGVADSRIFNNLIYDNHASGISLYKIDAKHGSYNTKVYNNTIINASNGRWCINIGTNATADTLYNNILINLHSWHGSIAVDAPAFEDFYSDYNIVIDAMSSDGDETAISLSDWQELGYDTHSMLANSMHQIFVNWENGDYHLLPTSQAVDSGTAIVSAVVINDLDGVSRPYGNEYDIGAYEYNPSETNIPDKTDLNPCKVIIKENYVIFDNIESNETIEIFDVRGSLIHKSGVISEITYRYNIESLPTGIYFWHVNNNHGDKVKGKIVIAR
jgi:parallel beta-helix repeat protein